MSDQPAAVETLTPPLAIAVFSPRAPGRAPLRTVFPRRRGRVLVARTADAFAALFRHSLVDAAVVDVATALAGDEETWKAAALAREFPSVPFFAFAPLHAADGPALARCASLEFADVVVAGVDDAVARELLARRSFTHRFARAFAVPPDALRLVTPLQQSAWRCLVAHAGRPLRTAEIAHAMSVTREHLSRTFATGGAPNLKRVIDLVRVVAAAELAKNPGYDIRDVAHILAFASPSHLSATAQRVAGSRPTSLARLRAMDLVNRFARGNGRSRR